MGDKKSRSRNANYAFNSQKEPMKNMGEGSFANMPEKPIYGVYGQPESYRDGIVNSFSVNIQDISELNENRRFNNGNQKTQKEVKRNRFASDEGVK